MPYLITLLHLALQLGVQGLHHLGRPVIVKEFFLLGHQPFQTGQLLNKDMVGAASDKSVPQGGMRESRHSNTA